MYDLGFISIFKYNGKSTKNKMINYIQCILKTVSLKSTVRRMKRQPQKKENVKKA